MPRLRAIAKSGNRFSDLPTNVQRIVRLLPRDDGRLLAYYAEGVGAFGLKEATFEWQKLPARIFGLAFGWGLKRTVEGAYGFLTATWRPGDEIFIFGFSRGAYAARALAALVHAVGILPPHQAHLFDRGWATLLARSGDPPSPDFALQARFKGTFARSATVHFLGLFDTVKSVGWVYDPVSIPFTTRNPSVRFVRQALSIEERRCFYRQHLWFADAQSGTDLKQVWFAGAHSDVGGGYPPTKAGLALVALRWMLGEAMERGLLVDETRVDSVLARRAGGEPDALASAHDSMSRAWKLAEWVPQLVFDSGSDKRKVRLGAMPPIGQPRLRPIESAIREAEGEGAIPLVHWSVEERMTKMNLRYPNVPNRRQRVEDSPLVGPTSL